MPTTTAPAESPAFLPSPFFGVVITRPDAIRRCLLDVINQTKSDFKWMSRSNPFGRHPVRIPFHLLPVGYDGAEISMPTGGGESLVANSRDVSLKGIGFNHMIAIQDQYLVASFPALEEIRMALLIERRWTKTRLPNEYLSGGRYLGVVVLRGREVEWLDEQPGWRDSLQSGALGEAIDPRSRHLLNILGEHLPDCIEIDKHDSDACGSREGDARHGEQTSGWDAHNPFAVPASDTPRRRGDER